MSKFLTALAFGAVLLLSAMPGFCQEFYEDPATGQIYTKPAEGRVAVGVPAEKIGGLYEDASGAIYNKPGEGRTPVAMTSQAAPQPQSEAAEPAADYSTQAFVEAVKHVISDEESTTYPKIKIGNLFYGKYSYDFEKGKANLDGRAEGLNKFDLTRGYINVRAELMPWLKVRVTPDISRDSTGDYKLRLKFGYVDFHDFQDFYPSFEVKVGQFEGPWLDYEENLWTYRMQNTMLVEREGFMNSADLGVNIQGKIPAGYGEWQADVSNGEGYHADEPTTGQDGRFKTIAARLTLVPLPNVDLLKGLQLTGFYTGGRAAERNNEILQRQRTIAFAGYKYQDDLFLGFEYLWTHGEDGTIVGSYTLPQPATGAHNYNGRGFSALAWYRMPFWKPIRLMGRFDQFDHDVDHPDAVDTRWVSGVSYDLGKYITFLVDNERQIPDKRLRKPLAANNPFKVQNLLEAVVQWKFN